MRFIRLLAVIAVLSVVGCSSSFEDLTTSGNAVAVAPNIPPGVIVNPGTGRVQSAQDAFNRVSTQFLGIDPPVLVNPRGVDNAVVGIGEQPPFNLYSTSGPLPAGSTIAEGDTPNETYQLPEPYYVFWADPNPLAKRGHKCSFLYLRESDGLLIEQMVDFDPAVDGQRIFELPAQQLEALCYTHQFFIDEGVSPLSAAPIVENRTVLSQVVPGQGIGQPGGPGFTGLAVVGAPDKSFDSDDDKFRDYFTGIGGDPNDFDSLDDGSPARIDSADLAKKIKDANANLGPDDKFLFCLSSHGTKAGSFQLGESLISWQELCRLLDQEVKAGTLNIIIDTCYAGLAVEAFEAWDTDRRVRLVTGTGTATPAYVGRNLECLLAELLDLATKAAMDGTLTLDELEKTFSDVDLTTAELETKICENRFTPGAILWKELRYKNDPTSGGLKLGSDDRPMGNDIITFFGRWADRVAAEDGPGLEPFYFDLYEFDGQTRQDLTTFDPDVDFSFGEFNVGFVGTDGEFVRLRTNQTLRTELNDISQVEQREMEFRLAEVPNQDPPFDIVSQRVVQQETTGTIGQNPPLQPNSPTFGGSPLNDLSGLLLSSGDQFVVLAEIRGLSNGVPPGESSSVGLALGDEFFPLRRTTGDNFTGLVVVPRLPDGQFVLQMFAENRVVSGGSQSFTSVSQSAEINVADRR